MQTQVKRTFVLIYYNPWGVGWLRKSGLISGVFAMQKSGLISWGAGVCWGVEAVLFLFGLLLVPLFVCSVCVCCSCGFCFCGGWFGRPLWLKLLFCFCCSCALFVLWFRLPFCCSNKIRRFKKNSIITLGAVVFCVSIDVVGYAALFLLWGFPLYIL